MTKIVNLYVITAAMACSVASGQNIVETTTTPPPPPARLQTQIQVDPSRNAAAQSVPSGTAEAYKNGKLYYHAVPSTPAPGSVVKIIDSKKDTDYAVKVYRLKTKGIAAEIGSFIRTAVDKENGKVEQAVDTETMEECLVVTAPDFQLAFIDDAIQQLDHPGLSYNDDGTVDGAFRMKHRLASEIAQVIQNVLQSKDAVTYSDNVVNMIYYKDDPSVYDATMEYVNLLDVPPEQVRIEAQIVEVENDADFNFGLALEAWKEGLPENVDMQLDFQQGSNNANMNIDPKSLAQYAAQSILIQGMRPKAMANFINYLSRSGHAKVLSSPTVVALNGQQATIASLDNIPYRAYSTPDTPLSKQTSTGVSLTITPTIGTETMTLAINAAVNSLIGWTSSSEPIVNTRTTTANVVLKDGELFTLSGLRKDAVTKADERVPVLGYIPLVGYAFRHEIDVTRTSEIIVFLTPRKVTPDKGITDRERAFLKKHRDEADAPPPSAAKDLLDKLILNKKP